MCRPRWIVAVLAPLVLAAGLQGDEPSSTTSLPRHYRKLDLSKKQQEQVRKTQAEYQARIDDLRQQLRSLQKEQSQALEKHLTDAQKTRLEELRQQRPGLFKLNGPTLPIRVTRGRRTMFTVELKPDVSFEGNIKVAILDLPRGVKIKPGSFVFKEGGDRLMELEVLTDKEMTNGEYSFTLQGTPDDGGEPVETVVRLVVFL